MSRRSISSTDNNNDDDDVGVGRRSTYQTILQSKKSQSSEGVMTWSSVRQRRMGKTITTYHGMSRRQRQVWNLPLLLLLLLHLVMMTFVQPCFAFSMSLRSIRLFPRRLQQAQQPMVQHIQVLHRQQQQQPLSSSTSSTMTTMTTTTTTSGSTKAVAAVATDADSSSSTTTSSSSNDKHLNGIQSFMVQLGLLSYIGGMCLVLPIALIGPWTLYKLRVLSRVQRERACLHAGHVCARFLLKLFPFCHVDILQHNDHHHHNDNNKNDDNKTKDVPSTSSSSAQLWVCNHSSMLDVFILLAQDHKLRGRHRRPIKIVYWKQLEENPITKLLFTQCGFIPVQMADNGHGTENEYDASSFRQLLQSTKRAFAEGFDVGILPEGQLNPTPEKGLLPIFSGAYTLAKLAKPKGKQERRKSSKQRKTNVDIRMMAHYNMHNIWHPIRGMKPTSRHVRLGVFSDGWQFTTKEEFVETFEYVVGMFATHGIHLSSSRIQEWRKKKNQQQQRQEEKKKAAMVNASSNNDGGRMTKTVETTTTTTTSSTEDINAVDVVMQETDKTT